MWLRRNTSVFVDISTYCNAGCPQCHRTDPGGTDKAEWLPLIKWSLEDFKKVYHPKLLHGYYPVIKNFEICGTWGDPAMSPDLVDMVDYIYNAGPQTYVSINSNGSIRDEDWWHRLGTMGPRYNRNIEVVFTVDGIDQEMHSKYRQKTSLEKTLANMDAFADGGGTAKIYTIVFKHNEDHLDQIGELGKKHGAVGMSWVASERYYYKKNQWDFVNHKGEQDKLEKSDVKYGWKSLR